MPRTCVPWWSRTASPPRCGPTRRRPRELDVTGVPYFLINGKWAVPGAQDVETMVTVLRRAWERTELVG